MANEGEVQNEKVLDGRDHPNEHVTRVIFAQGLIHS
jgi:hypothetical protein